MSEVSESRGKIRYKIILNPNTKFWRIFRRVHKVAKSDYYLLHAFPPVRLSVYKPSATGWIFIKYDIMSFFWQSVEKIQVSLKSDKNNGYFPFKMMDSISYVYIS